MTTVLGFALSGAALLVSVLAAIYSRRQASVASDQLALARQIRTEASEPYVIADIVPHVGGTGMLLFRIENVGPTMARDVQLSITPPLQGGMQNSWDERLARVIARRIPFLPPGRRIEWVFGMGYTIFGSDSLPRQYTVTVTTTGPSGPVEPLTYVIDLDSINESLLDRGSVEASLMKIVDHTRSLKDMAGDLHSVAVHTSGPSGVRRWGFPDIPTETSEPDGEEPEEAEENAEGT